MALTKYLQKRTFDKTPEPKPGAAQAEVRGNRFYVQRHSARRLHYDLRLEMDGVLKSWAVPKGPTLDPAEKRLAVHVEDHPLEYGEFEGTIPEGNYGAGSVLLWDRGTYEWLGDKPPAEQWKLGDLKFRLHGEKLMGDFALVRMTSSKKNEWLLIKKKDFAAKKGWDAEDDLRSVHHGAVDPALLPGAKPGPMPQEKDLRPMMAFSSDTLPEGAEWIYEVKWDGVRSLCFVEKGKVRLLSRNGTAMQQTYPELAALPESLAAETAIVDGEIVVLDEQGRPSFSLLQPRMMAGAKAAATLARSAPITLFAFDLLYYNGHDLRDVPLTERKRVLAEILKPGTQVRFSENFVGKGAELLAAARQTGLEGIVAKRALSRYESRRSKDWMKIKIFSQQEFVICGWTKGEREPFGALVLGHYDGDTLLWAGNVGSGFDQDALERVHQRLKPLVAEGSPFPDAPKELEGMVTWVRPEVVCTVRFASWTHEDRLRAPVFVGLRPDISPQECVRETAAADAPAAAEELAATQPVRPLLLTGKQPELFLTVDSQRLKFTNLNKVFYPREGYTKRDLINYYDAVSDLLLPYLRNRPLSLKRYPDGIEGEFFFQKDAPGSFPDWLRTAAIAFHEREEPTHFVVCDDRATLLYLANLGCIDQNPTMSRIGSLDNPDYILIDLDPHGCEFDRIVEAAQLVRRKLDVLGLAGYPKTTGGDGMHLYIPIVPEYSFAQARSFAEVLARLMANERPDLFTTPRSLARRQTGKVYFDYMQIGEGKTISAPYVLRAHPGAPVATPLEWREVAPGLSPAQFHIGNVLDRFARLGDVFQPVLNQRQRLEGPLEKLENLVREAAAKK
jgi:bifunctional non-homologous end joining protein LigD